MIDIDVICAPATDGWTCDVRLEDPDGTTTSHRVSVSRTTLEHLAPDADEPTDLVRRSFAFLLEREPRESILRSFDLPVIGRYFPDYGRAIRE